MSDAKLADGQTIHVHLLAGCSPKPLAHYLKALGVLRLVAEQADSKARGWWQRDMFRLSTKLNKEELESFFLDTYQPTPMVAPWNGGSGFFPKDNKSGIEPLTLSSAPRFEAFRSAISIGYDIVSRLDAKPEKGEAKNDVIAACRRAWRGGSLAWIDAALALGADGECSFPAILGTGGNDGRLDFTSNYMQRLVTLFDTQSDTGSPNSGTPPRLRLSLWGDLSPTLESSAIGQFFPGAAGGPNGTSGFDGGIRVNSWDYVLMLEGVVLFRSGLARRCSTQRLPQAAAPFAMRSSGAGYGSSDTSDAGPRGEQWMPLWSFPSTLGEVASIFREGRSQIGKQSATRGTDMARSIVRMGVTRGITQFERYGYIERNGLANLAVPLGRFDVKSAPNQDLLDEVAPWIDRLRVIALDKNAPAIFPRLFRNCEEAIFLCTRRPHDGNSFLDLLVAIARAEDQFLSSPRFAAEKNAAPIPWLSTRWLEVIQMSVKTDELLLARAFALLANQVEKAKPSQSVRHHWLPLDGSFFAKSESGLAISPDQCAGRLDLQRALLAVLSRRLQMMQHNADHQLPLHLPVQSLAAPLSSVLAFIQRRVDDHQILSIARGLMAIDCPKGGLDHLDLDISGEPLGGLATYGVLRLALPMESLFLGGDEVEVRINPIVYHRLVGGDLSRAVEVACRQLASVKLRPRIDFATSSTSDSSRLAAALAFGISRQDYSRLALGLTHPQMDSKYEHELEERYAELNLE